MSRPHDPYQDPRVRRRHRRALWRAIWRACKWLSLIGGGLCVVIAMIVGAAWGADDLGEYALVVLVGALYLVATGAMFLIPLLFILGVVFNARIRASGRAFGPYYCKACGYSLRGLAEPKCPECGRKLKMVREGGIGDPPY